MEESVGDKEMRVDFLQSCRRIRLMKVREQLKALQSKTSPEALKTNMKFEDPC